MVHLLCGIHQHRLALALPCGALRKLHRITHGINTDLAAGFAFFVVDVSLGFFTQRPAQCQHVGLRHQHTQVGVGAHADGVATATHTTSTLLRRRVFTQPSLHHGQPQRVLAQTRRALQQPCVAALGQQGAKLAADPRRERGVVGLVHHARPAAVGGFSKPRWTQVAHTCCQTWSRVWAASMWAKRAGDAAARAA